MPLDFNNAPEQRESGLIAEDTIATVHITVRPGGEGDGGWLKRSKNGDSAALDLEFTVVDGVFAKRKFWTLFTVQGETEGHGKAADISASRLRGILESARGIKPTDTGPEAIAGRRVDSWGEFDGLRCIVKIGVEKGKDGFKDKNFFDIAITPDKQQWHRVEQTKQQALPLQASPPAQSNQQAGGTGSKKPAWAS